MLRPLSVALDDPHRAAENSLAQSAESDDAVLVDPGRAAGAPDSPHLRPRAVFHHLLERFPVQARGPLHRALDTIQPLCAL